MPLADQVSGAAKNAALGSLGDIARSPLARAAMKYWWVAIPIAYAGWRSYQKHKAKGTVNFVDVTLDVAPLVGLVGTLVLLNKVLGDSEAQTPPVTAAPPRSAATPINRQMIKDADFTPRPSPVQEN